MRLKDKSTGAGKATCTTRAVLYFSRKHAANPLLCSCPARYRVPPGATPPKAAPERKFEGIKLEGGGVSVPAGTVSSLTICAACYADEEGRRAMGAQQRLPAGVTPTDLVCEKLEAMELWDRDPDGDMESEFFETRQVRCGALCCAWLRPVPGPPRRSLATWHHAYGQPRLVL